MSIYKKINSVGSFHLLIPRFWFPPGRGDLDWEVGWGEEGEDNGGDVVAAVVHALAEYPHDFLEG